jgi:D-beta-D-heptose 7-phosphate kinase/D-beta-D-heptose 1-phosphate adenosyltransferase
MQEIEKCYKSLCEVKLDKVIDDNETNKLENFRNKNVVFTNGCFDIVHSAHLKLLNFCREKADILIVGLNSDASIKQLKGDNRPINDLSERIEFLSNLKFIDYIVVFNELTPYNILKHIKPDIIVKGGDYTIENIVGAEFAKDIILFDYIQNKSTSLVVKKIHTLTDKKKLK